MAEARLSLEQLLPNPGHLAANDAPLRALLGSLLPHMPWQGRHWALDALAHHIITSRTSAPKPELRSQPRPEPSLHAAVPAGSAPGMQQQPAPSNDPAAAPQQAAVPANEAEAAAGAADTAGACPAAPQGLPLPCTKHISRQQRRWYRRHKAALLKQQQAVITLDDDDLADLMSGPVVVEVVDLGHQAGQGAGQTAQAPLQEVQQQGCGQAAQLQQGQQLEGQDPTSSQPQQPQGGQQGQQGACAAAGMQQGVGTGAGAGAGSQGGVSQGSDDMDVDSEGEDGVGGKGAGSCGVRPGGGSPPPDVLSLLPDECVLACACCARVCHAACLTEEELRVGCVAAGEPGSPVFASGMRWFCSQVCGFVM